MDIPPLKGIYLLLIRVEEEAKICLKGDRRWLIPPGNYFYAGSAKGPGGLKARIARHLKRGKRFHWHIDFLLASPGSKITHVIYAEANVPECALVSLLEKAGCMHVIEGFGSSDCKSGCVSHLAKCHYSMDKCLQIAISSFKALKLSPRVVSNST
jgi:Uri superfamily endonuclease